MVVPDDHARLGILMPSTVISAVLFSASDPVPACAQPLGGARVVVIFRFRAESRQVNHTYRLAVL
jgi:hypothetical protein